MWSEVCGDRIEREPVGPAKRVEGIEPSSLAWKAIALPLSYTRAGIRLGSAGFEPAKAEPSDLQSDPFDRSGNSPLWLNAGLLRIFPLRVLVVPRLGRATAFLVS
jgi:hypothetical protein